MGKDILFQKRITDSGFSGKQEIFLMQMHSDGIKRMEKAVTRKMDERFTAYGFDIRSPNDIQKDMAKLSQWRKLSDSISNKLVVGFIILVVSIVTFFKVFIPVGGK